MEKTLNYITTVPSKKEIESTEEYKALLSKIKSMTKTVEV